MEALMESLELAAFHIPELQAKFVPQTKGIATNEDLGHSGRRAGIDGRLGAGAEPAASH